MRSKGKIFLVGFGPGAEEHMTFRARQAIQESDVVIGYSTYIRLVRDLLDNKQVIRKGMTEEIDRCVDAYEQAQQGKTVALISSGDIGVYGMAGPTYEVLLQAGWKPNDGIEVEVVPGATALNACASLVGAPLTHDFCSISLSDLLTPWPVIARRIQSAAQGDFVVALYNPKSGRRRQQIIEAQRILLEYRKPDTPVAIVKSAYRDRQNIQMVTLDSMSDCDIGMLTTVLVGNSSSFMQDNLMITPRGYANKYQTLTGEVKQGEKAGRSLSMGLEGWKACARRYIRENPDSSIKNIAKYFNVPQGKILEAISETATDDPAADYTAAVVEAEQLDTLLQATHNLGCMRAVIKAESGAVSELFVETRNFEIRGDWLNIITDTFHMHVQWKNIQRAWFCSRGDDSHGLYFVDHQGELIFSLLMIKQGEKFNSEVLEQFYRAQQQLTQPQAVEVA